MKVSIFTDGGCTGNPGPGAWAAILSCGCHAKEISGVEPHTTNSRMELTAAIEALSALKFCCEVSITSDSKYLVRGAGEWEWLKVWKSRGWTTSSGRPVKNRDLWETLDMLLTKHKVQFSWVRGHNGHPQNTRCDAIVRSLLSKQDS